MRSVLNDVAKSPQAGPHPGLLLERYAEIEMTFGHKDRGKVPNQQRQKHIQEVCSVAVPKIYSLAFSRWKASLSDACTVEVQATSRLLIGHGNPSPLGVGLTLHPVYGVPIIPGSALKGVLNHYLASRGLVGFDGVGYEGGSPVRPPGFYHRTLFGSPAFRDQQDEGARGFVSFEDAWYIPDSGKAGTSDREPDCPLVPDILTPHQKDYYQPAKGSDPTDWDEPNPVSFITVRPGACFLLAISSPDGRSDWAHFALEQLLEALSEMGVGGKVSSAGYGRLSKVDQIKKPRPRAPKDTPALLALREAVLRFQQQEEGKLAAFDAENWVFLIQAVETAHFPFLREVLAPLFNHRKLQKARASKLHEITALLPIQD